VYLLPRQQIVIPLATAHSQNTLQVCYLNTLLCTKQAGSKIIYLITYFPVQWDKIATYCIITFRLFVPVRLTVTVYNHRVLSPARGVRGFFKFLRPNIVANTWGT
jgi:hypothetical protein